MTAHLNWFLLGAGENTSNLQTGVPNECISSSNPKVPLGDTLGNPMGNGMVSIARVDGHSFPSPEYMQQSGYAQTTRDFFDSSYNVPNCPDPNNPNDQPNTRKHAEFALEFSPSVSILLLFVYCKFDPLFFLIFYNLSINSCFDIFRFLLIFVLATMHPMELATQVLVLLEM